MRGGEYNGRGAGAAARGAQRLATGLRAGAPYRVGLGAAILTGLLLGAGSWTVLGLHGAAGSDAAPASLYDARGSDAPGCTSFSIDRGKGDATAGPCRGEILAWREAIVAGRY
jgi:hypothetical protein